MSEEQAPQNSQPQTQTQSYQIGYALEPKKIQNALGNSLFDYAKERGIDLIQIDLSKPLTQQGPFHCIIHKLESKDWEKLHLNEYIAENPHGVTIIDPLELVEKLKNRASMLDAMTELEISSQNVTVGIPNQMVVDQTNNQNNTILESSELEPMPDSNKETSLNREDCPNYNKKDGLDHISNRCETRHNIINHIYNGYETQGLDMMSFPLIAKPFYVDGTASSHKLCLVFDRDGLTKTLEMNKNNPVVLQEFVNHGGVVFKVYVAGEHVTCVKRKSLPDISENEAKTLKGTVDFSYISYFTAPENGNNNNNNNNDDKGDDDGDVIQRAEMPPENFVRELAKGLREAMGLNMFNVDVIRDAKDCNRYLVIDINYFPGYAKLPCYEPFVTDFLLDLVVPNKKTAEEVRENGNEAI